MDLRVRGKSYVIVGGSKGMGWEAAKTLAEDGANLAIVSRDGTRCQEQARRLAQDHGIRAIGLGADGTEAGEMERAIESAIKELGTIRGLLATPGSTSQNGTLLDMTEEDWTANFNSVLMCQVRSCKAILPHLLENGGGNIVTTAAYSARAAKKQLFGYASLKAGLVNFTKNIAKTYGGQGIRANCVCPGWVETGKVQNIVKETAQRYNLSREEAIERLMVTEWKMPVALCRVGQANELGDIMAFLISERSAYTTGAIVNVDGGTDF